MTNDILHEQNVFLTTLSTCLILVALLLIYNRFFVWAPKSSGMMKIFQLRLRFWYMAFVFLIPLRWAIGNIREFESLVPATNVLIAVMAVITAIETALTLAFRYSESGEARISPHLRLSARLLIYGILFIAGFLIFHGQYVLHNEIIYNILSVFIFYIIMHVSYTQFFKWMQWKHPLALALSQRLRFYIYIAIIVGVADYAYVSLDFFDSLPFEMRKGIESNFHLAFLTILFIIGFEAALTTAFDFIFPKLRRIDVPHLFRDLIRTVVYFGLFVFVLGVVLKQDLSTLLLGSTVASIIIGLALQETLGNFFAGLALGISKPYTIGDFLQVDNVTGKVEKIDWRSTAVLTQTGDYIILPNTVLSKAQIQNYSAPTTLHARFIDVGCHYRHAPNTVKQAIIEAASSIDEVLSLPQSEVWLMSFDESSINYRLRFWLEDYQGRFLIESKVREAIWYRFNRENIEIPFPMRNIIQLHQETDTALKSEVRTLLEKVDFLNSLRKEDLSFLSTRVRYLLFARSETVFNQGEQGDSFYIIKSGRLTVTAQNQQGEVFLTTEMIPGQYFGEMALLTGEPRSATVKAIEDSELLVLEKDDLRTIIQDNPQAEEVISRVLAKRQLRTQKAQQESEEEKSSTDEKAGARSIGERLDRISEQFLKKMRDFFSY
ncbi:MAG: cyclic nucleotide-binding domain-containing protein [Candidatus Xenobiia bacterium LiM19]